MKLDKPNAERRIITAEEYENDFRQKPVLMGLNTTTKGFGGNQQNIQPIDCYNYRGMQTLDRKPVVLNW